MMNSIAGLSGLSWDDYQRKARATAAYPTEYNLIYPVLGLAGEAGEFAHAVGQSDEKIIKELGDIYWYVANIAHDAGISLLEVAKLSPGSVSLWTPGIASTVGNVCEVVKKTIRDHGNVWNVSRVLLLKEALRDVLEALRVTVDCMPYTTVRAVLETNLKKLESRKARGTIQGEGDNR